MSHDTSGQAGHGQRECRDLDALFREQFAQERRHEGYRLPLDHESRDIQAQVVTAATQMIGASPIVLDYGSGLGALIEPLCRSCSAVRTYVCVNHADEIGGWHSAERRAWVPCAEPLRSNDSVEPIADALAEQIARLQEQFSDLAQIDFQHRTDAELVQDMYEGRTTEAHLLVCLDTLHHIPLPELPEKLASMLHHVRLGGDVAIGDLQQATHYEVGRFWWDAEALEQVLDGLIGDLKVRNLNVPGGKTVLATGHRRSLPAPRVLVECLKTRCWSVYRESVLRKAAELQGLREKILAAPQDSHGTGTADGHCGNDGPTGSRTRPPADEEAFVRKQVEHRDTLQQMMWAEQCGWFQILSPGDHLVVVTFHQTSTGKECVVAKDLAAAYRAQGVAAKVLITLGQYDVCTIEEFADLDAFRDAALITEPNAHVFSTNSHACFSLAPIDGTKANTETPTTRRLAELHGALLGICFLKLNPQHVAEHGFRAESAIVTDLIDKALRGELLSGCSYSFLGGLGWSELVLLLSSDEAEAIYAAVAKIRDLPHPLCPTGAPALLTSFTVLGTEHDKVDQADKAIAGLDLAIGVSTFGGQKEPVRRDLLNSSGLAECTWRGVLGKLDFLGVRTAGVGGIDEVIRLRQDPLACGQLLTTSTIPMIRMDASTPSAEEDGGRAPELPSDATSVAGSAAGSFDFGAEADAGASPAWPVTPDPAAEELSLYQAFREGMPSPSPAVHLVRQAFSEYISCRHDPLLRYDVLDLRRALHRIHEEALAWSGSVWAKDREHILYNAARVVLYGLRQRYTGTYDTIYNLNDVNTTGMAVGAQRLFGASEAICSTTLTRYSPAPWTGFVVYGNAVVPFRDHFGTLNFPSEAAFDLCQPARLWFLHELGHEVAAAADRRLFAVDAKQPDLTQLDQRDLQADMLADVFVLIAGFDGSLDAYFGAFRQHIYDMLHEDDPWWRTRYFQRILGLCAYQAVVDQQTDGGSPEFNLGGYLQLLFDRGCIEAREKKVEFVLEQLAPESLLPDLSREERKQKTMAQVKWIIDRIELWHETWLGPVVRGLQLHSYAPSPAYVRDVAGRLQEGKIVLSPILCWAELLRELDNGHVGVQQQMAMIVSLWHTWVQNTSHSVDIQRTASGESQQ